jgi:hypothetical protein
MLQIAHHGYFPVGTEYPLQTRGYVCSDEASLLKAGNDWPGAAAKPQSPAA